MDASDDDPLGDDQGADSLERICLLGKRRVARRAFAKDPALRLWVLQFARWSFMLDAAGSPGVSVGECASGLWHAGPSGKEICREALRWLVRRGVLRGKKRGRRFCLYPTEGPSLEATLAAVWGWLNEHSEGGPTP